MIIIFLFDSFSFAQLPDWTLIIDKDLNKYYIDKNGKIWTSGKPEFDYKAVSTEGLDYYLNQGIELIKSHNKSKGLLLLKSIMALPIKNNITHEAQSRALNEINRLIKTEGARFKEINEKSSLLLFKDNNYLNLINDEMLYSIKSPYTFKIISKRTRAGTNYKYFGLLLGFTFKEKRGDNDKGYQGYSGYDFLFAVDSERFHYQIKNVNNIENHWRNRLGADTLERKLIKKNNIQIVNSYKDKYSPNYSGFESYYSKNNFGYYLKVITSKELFQKYEANILEIINNFNI